jgi:glycerol uptake facilitator-like aquaporin
LIAEWCGVLLFQLFGGASPPKDTTAPAANGFALVAIIYAFCNISGAHLNPAVTFALTCTGHMPVWRGLCYMAAQVRGGGGDGAFALFHRGNAPGEYFAGGGGGGGGRSRGAGFFMISGRGGEAESAEKAGEKQERPKKRRKKSSPTNAHPPPPLPRSPLFRPPFPTTKTPPTSSRRNNTTTQPQQKTTPPCQILGAIFGSLIYTGLIPGLSIAQKHFHGGLAPGCFGPAPGVTAAELFGWESLMTMLLVLTVYAAAVTKPGHGNAAPLAIGLSLYAAALTGGPYTGASLNPARTIGPACVFACNVRISFLYVASEMFGAALAAGLCIFLYGRAPVGRAAATAVAVAGAEGEGGGGDERAALQRRQQQQQQQQQQHQKQQFVCAEQHSDR